MNILELKFSNSEIYEDRVNIVVNTNNFFYYERWTYSNRISLTLKIYEDRGNNDVYFDILELKLSNSENIWRPW